MGFERTICCCASKLAFLLSNHGGQVIGRKVGWTVDPAPVSACQAHIKSLTLAVLFGPATMLAKMSAEVLLWTVQYAAPAVRPSELYGTPRFLRRIHQSTRSSPPDIFPFIHWAVLTTG